MHQVRVKEPYKLADVIAVHGSSTAACQRVKKVVSKVLELLRLKALCKEGLFGGELHVGF